MVIEDEKKFDLARLFIDIYGVSYVGHPRLEKLLEKNSIEPLNFLNGPQEAEAFPNRNYVGLHQSTLRKVDVIANVAGRAHDRNLKVNTTRWQMHGGRLRTALNWLIENKFIAFLASALGIAAFVGRYGKEKRLSRAGSETLPARQLSTGIHRQTAHLLDARAYHCAALLLRVERPFGMFATVPDGALPSMIGPHHSRRFRKSCGAAGPC